LGFVPEEPGPADVIAGQRQLLSRLRAVVEAKDADNAVLRAALDASLERERRLELRLAEAERRLSMDSDDSYRGAPGGVPFLQGGPGRREARGSAVGAGHRRGDRPDGNRMAAAGLFVPVLRDGHVRGAAGGRLTVSPT
jgi:hypothetical protein